MYIIKNHIKSMKIFEKYRYLKLKIHFIILRMIKHTFTFLLILYNIKYNV